MALSAARSDLTISIVGEDETQQAIEQANANMRQLEARLKSLQAAGRGQAAVAKTQTSALDAVNGKMKGLAGVAEGAVDGVDKMKSAFDKVLGVAGFVAPAIAGIAAGVTALVEGLGLLSPGLSRSEQQFWDNRDAAQAYRVELGELKKAIDDAEASADSSAGSFRALAREMVGLIGDETEKAMLTQVLDAEELAERQAEVGKKFFEAQRQEAELANQLESQRKQRLKTQDELLRVNQGIAFAERNRNLEYAETLKLRRVLIQDELADIQDAERGFERQLEAVQRNVLNLESVLGLFEQRREAAQQAAPAAAARRAGGGMSAADRRRQELDRAEREAQALISSLQAELGNLYEAGAAAVDVEMEFERDLAAAAKARAERRKKELDEARKAAEEAAKLQQEMAEKARFDLTEPVFEFADALRGSLIPELDALGGVMDRVMAQFDLFREGQVSLTQAIAAGATEIAASAARSIGGVKAEAAVRAAYEFGMGFATLANPVISAGHFTAAALLGGVATGIISTGGGKGSSGASGGMGKPAGASMSSGASTGASGGSGSVTNVYNLSAGVVDGQSTTRAFRRAEIQSRNTGFAHAGGW
jgi:hypothetical protein